MDNKETTNGDTILLERGSDKAFYEDMLEEIKWQRGNPPQPITRPAELQRDLSVSTQNSRVEAMDTINFDDLPETLETLDDYNAAMRNVIMPMMKMTIQKVNNVIEDLHNQIEEGNLTDEDINQHLNQIVNLTKFTAEDSLYAPYFNKLVSLEQKLYEDGLLTGHLDPEHHTDE